MGNDRDKWLRERQRNMLRGQTKIEKSGHFRMQFKSTKALETSSMPPPRLEKFSKISFSLRSLFLASTVVNIDFACKLFFLKKFGHSFSSNVATRRGKM